MNVGESPPHTLTPLELATCVVKLNVSHEIRSSVSLSLGTLQTFWPLDGATVDHLGQ